MLFHHGQHTLSEILIVLSWSNQRELAGSVVVNISIHPLDGLLPLLNVAINCIGVPCQFVDNI